MTTQPIHSPDQYPTNIQERVSGGVRYSVFPENLDTKSRHLARLVHARSYLKNKFIKESGMDDKGEMTPDLDHARGDNVRVFLALPDGVDHDDQSINLGAATLKKVEAQSQDYHSLPMSMLCNDVQLGRINTTSEPRLIELSALGCVGDSVLLFKLLKEAIHDGIKNKEVWVFALVSTTYEILREYYGDEAFVRIGPNVNFNDARVSDKLELVPLTIDPGALLSQLLISIRKAEPGAQEKMIFTLGMLCEGLESCFIPDEVTQYLIDSRVQKREKGVGALAFMEVEDTSESKSWTEPKRYKLSEENDVREISNLHKEGKIKKITDDRATIARELFELHRTEQDFTMSWQEYYEQIVNKDSFGTWFFYPWSGELELFPDEDEFIALKTWRNKDLITEEEQLKLRSKTVLQAGLSVGSKIIEELVASSACGTIIHSDPDILSATNLNRVDRPFSAVGENKVDITAKYISERDPYMRQILYREGVSAENIREIFEVHSPDVVFDSVDDLRCKALLRIEAARRSSPLLMATDSGESSIIDVERYDTDQSTLPFNGRVSVKDVLRLANGDYIGDEERLKLLVKIVGLKNISPRLLKSTSKRPSIPQLSITASRGGADVVSAWMAIVSDRGLNSGRYTTNSRRTLKLKPSMARKEAVLEWLRFAAANRSQ